MTLINRANQNSPGREASIKISLIAILVSLLFAPVVFQLIHFWSTREDYSHGFFIIPLAVFIVWTKRKNLLLLPVEPLWAGLPVLFTGTMAYVVSFMTNFHTLTHLSMILIILGLLLFLTGWKITKELLLPILFLLFMFPIPGSYYVLITNPLKLLITNISTHIIQFMGFPVYREGNIIFLSTTQLEVVEACSGLRSLYSYLMIGCLFAFMSHKRMSKIVLITSTIPLALLINIIRVTGTGILSNFFGSQVAQGFFHTFSGLILFVFGFVILLIEYHFLESGSTKKAVN